MLIHGGKLDLTSVSVTTLSNHHVTSFIRVSLTSALHDFVAEIYFPYHELTLTMSHAANYKFPKASLIRTRTLPLNNEAILNTNPVIYNQTYNQAMLSLVNFM